MPETAIHVFIEGRVQGVWFRGWTEKQATRLGLSGWVRNLRDGRVEAIFSGGSNNVETMLALCRKGPPMARVDNIVKSVTDVIPSGGFETRPTV
ncbi:MAG: acylphosphatase [Rhodospirillales bacterium]|nr:acylphosphatase [Rhodospirillales bacterium]